MQQPSQQVLAAALTACEQPVPAGAALLAAAAAVRFAAGGPDAPAADAVAAWSLIAPAYAAAWSRMRAPLGLLAPSGGARGGGALPLVVVHGGACGVMRPLEATEAMVSSSAAAAAALDFAAGAGAGVGVGGVGGGNSFRLAPTASPATKALAAGAYLNTLLGAPACHAFDLVAMGVGQGGTGGGGAGFAASPAAAAAAAAAASFAATEDWLDAAVVGAVHAESSCDP
jgi:hypothetical protein